MRLSEAWNIFTTIDDPNYTEKEKATAIYMVMNAATHNSIKKGHMLAVIGYLWRLSYKLEDEE